MLVTDDSPCTTTASSDNGRGPPLRGTGLVVPLARHDY